MPSTSCLPESRMRETCTSGSTRGEPAAPSGVALLSYSTVSALEAPLQVLTTPLEEVSADYRLTRSSGLGTF